MESSFLVERGCIISDATPFSMSRTDRRRSVDLDLGGCGFGFVAQCVEVGVERVVADDDAHAAVELGRGLAENAQVGVLLAADLLFAPVTRLFPACDRREDDGAGAGSSVMRGIGRPSTARQCSSNSLRFCVPASVTIPVSCGRGDSSEK